MTALVAFAMSSAGMGVIATAVTPVTAAAVTPARAAQAAYLEEEGGIAVPEGDANAIIDANDGFGKVVAISGGWVDGSMADGIPSRAAGTFKDASVFAKSAWTLTADVKVTDAEDNAGNLVRKAAFAIGTKDQSVSVLLGSGRLGYGSTSDGASSQTAAFSTKPNRNDWASVAIVYTEDAKSGSVAAYIDGEQVLAPTAIGFKLSAQQGTQAFLGHGFNTNFTLNGTYDGITVSNAATSAADAKADTAARVRAKRNATIKDGTNKEALKASLAKAQSIAKDGKTYAAHSKQLLDEAIAQASTVRDGSSYTQGQVNWWARVLDAVANGMEERDRNDHRYSAVQVGKTWRDTDGSAIQAHGGGFLQQTDTDGKPIYYWVGEDKTHNSSNFNGITLYSSKDLVNWTFRNTILRADANVAGLTDNKIERPKLVYNAKTHKYVLWGHWEASDGYSSSQIAVAVSDTVDGEYEFLGHWRPGADQSHRNWRVQGGKAFFDGTNERISNYGDTRVWGTGSRDLTVFVDDDGAAYLLSAQDGTRMRIYRLNDDYTDVAFDTNGKPAMTYLMFDGGRREAPALSKVDGKYYLITSGQSGWYPNQGRYSYTTNLSDPKGWKLDADGKSPFAGIGNNSTFYSQPTNIMQIHGSAGTTLVYMGDRWTPYALSQSTYVWLPLAKTGDTANPLSMSYVDGWSLDTATGKVGLPDMWLLSRGKDVKTSTDAAVSDKDDSRITYANDGNYGTSFRAYASDGITGAMPFTYTVDLGKAYLLKRVDLSTRLVNGSETYYQYTIETSEDGKTWTTRVDQSDNKMVGFRSDALNKVTARYVRLNVIKVLRASNDGNPDIWTTGIQEFEVYGSDAIAPMVNGRNAPAGSPVRFSDLAGASHVDDIEWLSRQGISRGYVDDGGTVSFGGMRTVVRQDMAAFLYRMAGKPAVDVDAELAKRPFTDVDRSTPHVEAVLWLAKAGISTGYDNGDGTRSFGGMRTVVRQDLAALLRRYAQWADAAAPSGRGAAFTDVSDRTPHHDDIAWLSRTGVTTGYDNGDGTVSFGGMRDVVRQDMAAFLHRMSTNVLAKR